MNHQFEELEGDLRTQTNIIKNETHQEQQHQTVKIKVLEHPPKFWKLYINRTIFWTAYSWRFIFLSCDVLSRRHMTDSKIVWDHQLASPPLNTDPTTANKYNTKPMQEKCFDSSAICWYISCKGSIFGGATAPNKMGVFWQDRGKSWFWKKNVPQRTSAHHHEHQYHQQATTDYND